MTNHVNSKTHDPHELEQDDSDADALAVLSLLVILTAAIAFYLRT